MFGNLKSIFRRKSESAETPRTPTLVARQTGFRPVTARPLATRPAPAAAQTPPPATTDFNAEDVSIPLGPVLNALPADLKSRVGEFDVRGATLSVSLTRVLPQLAAGAANLTFGELRRAAPQLFSPGEDADDRKIELPMSELLARINPALLPQPKAQAATVGPDAANSSFNASRSGSTPMRVPLPAGPKEPAPTPATAAPTLAPATNIPHEPALNVALASLAAAWPEAVRNEITQLNCAHAWVALPEHLVQDGMKRGRVAFPWKTVRSWLLPPPSAAVSRHDDETLELPLDVLMPLFLAHCKPPPKSQQKVVLDETIPELFSAAQPAAVTGESGSDAAGAVKPAGEAAAPPKPPDTDFANRYISPTEVVARATALTGVAGALVLLPEGLLVAGKVSADQNADTLAALLARAFGHFAQCATEARIGEPTGINFTADNVPWQIYCLNGVLLAVSGVAGGTLPAAELAALAGALDRKKHR